jgi:hypothetical protein
MGRPSIGKEHPQIDSILAVTDVVRTITHLSNNTTDSRLKTELAVKIKNVIVNHSDILQDEGQKTAHRLAIELDKLEKNQCGFLNSNITKLFCEFAKLTSKALHKKN